MKPVSGEVTALSSAAKFLEQYKDISVLTTASYPQGTVEIEKALDEIAKKSPSLVLCMARPRAAYTFIRSALNKGLHDTMFVGTTELETVQKILKTAWGIDLVVTSVVPRVEDNKHLPIVQEYLKVMKNFLTYHDDSPFYLEMFINMSLFEHALYKVQGEVTGEKLIRVFEDFREMGFEGLPLNFDAATRSLSSALWINPGYGKKWIKV